MDAGQLAVFLSAAVRMATPLLIAALGLSISERAGIVNLGVEGIMLMAAFGAYLGAKLTGSYWLGLACGITAATLITSILAVTTIRFKAYQIIVGAALNIFCAGLSSFLYRRIFYGTGLLDDGVAAVTFPSIAIPFLSSLPFLGRCCSTTISSSILDFLWWRSCGLL